MDALKGRRVAQALAAGAVALGLALAAFAGPPIAAMRAHPAAAPQKPAAAPQKTAPTNQKATTATHSTGQPRQTCGSASAPETPGHASSAPGSAFNPNGNAGTHYAGTQPQNSKNPTSSAQYDVACSNQK